MSLHLEKKHIFVMLMLAVVFVAIVANVDDVGYVDDADDATINVG